MPADGGAGLPTSAALIIRFDIAGLLCCFRERVIAGQKAAKRRGVRFGRPAFNVDTDRALKLRKQGLSWRDISAEMGVPKDTLIRHCEAQ